MPTPRPEQRPTNFIEQLIAEQSGKLAWGVWSQADATPAVTPGTPRVHTRFPPEPNGYLHIGHAKSICLNFGLAKTFGGKFNLRFDDTNPSKEEQQYVDAIKRDVKWLGADFTGPNGGGVHYASEYFPKMFAFAEELISKGLAYVCELSADEVAKRRGSVGVPATSPHRDRPIVESLLLFREMRQKKYPNGAMTLRAKIDLASPNFNLRDPVLYRIIHESHQHTGDEWCIYPMYDFAHGYEDSIEHITHSICTLEFEDHRPLYHWFIDSINLHRAPAVPPSLPESRWGSPIHHPQQIEFAKLRPTFTVLSKRNLLRMVLDNVVDGWDDPRMPTIAGFRRRGYTPAAIRAFCEDVGVTKVESFIDFSRLENAQRDDFNASAPRRMGVLKPLKIIIDNWPEGKIDELSAVNNPEDPSAGSRMLSFGKEIYIDAEDFMEHPAKKFFRLSPGQEVRLRWAYVIRCERIVKDAAGQVVALHCTHDPETRGGNIPLGPDGKPNRKVQGTIHWVSAHDAIPAEVRLFDRLFIAEHPGTTTGNWKDDLNPNSLDVVTAMLEPSLSQYRFHPQALDGAGRGDTVQFERLGYFTLDRDSLTANKLIFNRTVTLKDSYAKEATDLAPAVGGMAHPAPAGGGGGRGSGGRIYALPEAAHELKIKPDKLLVAIPRLAETEPSLAKYPLRNPPHLTLAEVRAMKAWLKTNLQSLG